MLAESLALQDRIRRCQSGLRVLARHHPTIVNGKFDNRTTWDNKTGGGGFDNRPTWDNWNK